MNEKIRDATNFDELLDIKYGKISSEKRDEFEAKAQYFVISEMLKEARKEAKMTQEQLAEKVGMKKSYISRLENGKCDIQLSTLYKIFEFGLGKKINLTIYNRENDLCKFIKRFVQKKRTHTYCLNVV